MLHPYVVFVLSFFGLWLAASVGAALRHRKNFEEVERQDLSLLLAATLTLLGLLIGFTFSMAVNHYDQRKDFEGAEANAIGTQFLRADLLPDADRDKVRTLLKKYIELRVQFYEAREGALPPIDAATAKLQSDLWAVVLTLARNRQDAVAALAVQGMNDVIGAQGNTQASWWNRLPMSAVLLMSLIAICANVLVGYAWSSVRPLSPRLAILPRFVAIAFMLISDIDAPRTGMIQVPPLNLEALAHSLKDQR